MARCGTIPAMPRAKKRRAFGSTRKLPSGRIQARYVCPTCSTMHPLRVTYSTLTDADTALANVRSDMLATGTCARLSVRRPRTLLGGPGSPSATTPSSG